MESTHPVEEKRPLIDTSDFARMVDNFKEVDQLREKVIKQSRDVLKSSKFAIFALHRGDFTGSKKLLTEAKVAIDKIVELLSEKPSQRQGSFSNALEEYIEATLFYHYLVDGYLLPSSQLDTHVSDEEYLAGVIDFTGELGRYAVAKATKRDTKAVEECRNLCDLLMEQLLNFDFRNGSLRKKYDAVKYNLKKMEQILYELSLTDNLRGIGVGKFDNLDENINENGNDNQE
mmetsp:Transcript_16242/g.18266  ORF Transcript_16242/g.18266 Transcript_16242/m.18266 type:complete len:231 (+) Transcript_16242:160-852(+)|eukprot:CAMPEP_0115010780 /NCGR_PEP_ID=MMETSP0216-20121206/23543_1 /TAXON_ID=223996 /ORGANISM="Protocruzia adherens, Strain Boccale" /LENGTH=230 /DNA_ID=CAMNT_0002379107 /DNA_START=78 /DNA_END=770 /DNA_ORIENTATION=+